MRNNDTVASQAFPADRPDDGDTHVESLPAVDDDRTQVESSPGSVSGTLADASALDTADETQIQSASASSRPAQPPAAASAAGDDATRRQSLAPAGEDCTVAEPLAATRPGDSATELPVAPSRDGDTRVERSAVGDDRTEGAAPLDDDATVPLSHLPDDESRRTMGGGGGQETIVKRQPSAAAPSPPDPPASSRPYELLEPFAQGGLGRIWRARDVRIGRDVAYKELLPRARQHRDQVVRFVEEAQVTGQLEHPGIVPIYDFGWKEDGAPYYCMKLVHGRTLRDAIREYHQLPRGGGERRLALARLLRSFIAVCNAVAFAHRRGVLHRDLKPLNVMLGEFGETFVLDWGMVKIVEAEPETETDHPSPAASPQPRVTGDETRATQAVTTDGSSPTEFHARHSTTHAADATHHGTGGSSHVSRRSSIRTSHRPEGTETQIGSVMGTPNYMSPEQAAGLVSELDPRSDIYSLGAMLYELLTNQSPVPEKGLIRKIKYIIEGRLVTPRTHDATIPRALEAICLKALARRKEDRYPTALALSADVEAWLADEPVSAFAEPWHARTRRWARRHRTTVAAIAVAAALLALGLIGWRVSESRRIATARSSAETRIADAQSAISTEDFVRAERLLAEADGLVESEPALADLRRTIRIQEEHADQLRLAAARREIDQRLAEARRLTQPGQDPDDARPHLAAALAMAAEEPSLTELARTVEEQLATIEATVSLRRAEAAAQDQFQRFLAKADHARFYGGFFSGESVDQDAADARQHATAALALYGLDDGAVAADWQPPHLAESQVREIRATAFELMLVLAEAEQLLARRETPEKRAEAAERALELLGGAGRLGITSQALHLREALCYEQLGRSEDRDAARRRAAATPPATALDHFLIAEIARKADDFPAALHSYRDALRADPDHHWALHFSGFCHLLQLEQARSSADRLSLAEAAVADLTAAVSQRADFPWSYLIRAVAYAELRQFDAALADLDAAAKLAPELMAVPLNRGAVLLIRGDYDGAVAQFQRAAELRPDRADPHINLAEAHRHRGDALRANDGLPAALPHYQQAIADLTTAAGLSPANPKIYRLRGDLHQRLDAGREAIRDYRRAIEFDHSPVRVARCHLEIGRIYHRSGDHPAALDAYDDALAALPGDAVVHRLRAELLLSMDRPEEAVESFTRFLDLTEVAFPPAQPPGGEIGDLGDVYRARALARAELGRYREAVSDYTRALELEPSANMLTRRGWAFLLQAAELARADFDEAVRLNPENSDSYAGRGYARALLGDYAGAAADADQAIRLARRQVEAQGGRAWPLLFNPATILAQIVGRIAEDTALPVEEREALSEAHAAQAVEWLVEAGRVAGAEHQDEFRKALQTDPALDPIRRRPEFETTLDPVRP